MNLNKLFSIQAKLDERIIEEHGLHGEDLLDKKILALQVELGELANEWRGFKFWSKDQEARTEDDTWYVATETIRFYQDTTHSYNEATVYQKYKRNPLLEEYVDCLHFILSIGLELEIEKVNIELEHLRYRNITFAFNTVFDSVSTLEAIEDAERNDLIGIDELRGAYKDIACRFVKLGELLGFTWNQIEQAYLDKNKINHERQNNGY